jgi:sulfite reductase (ferredoxin)
MISPHVQELIRNLGIASSTGIAEELERVLKLEIRNTKRIEKLIKISGCMNARTTQHVSNWFSGMSIKAEKLVAPALKYFWWEFRNGSGRFQIK